MRIRCRVAAMVEEYGQGDSMEWLANWERVWQDNLDSCDKAGNCLIKLS